MLQTLGKAIVVCLVDFTMVFLVMAGLQGALAIMRRVLACFSAEARPSPIHAETPEAHPAVLPAPPGQRSIIAAVTAAVHAFTGQPEGAIRINYIEPLGERPAATASDSAVLAAITASIQAFTNLPVGQFQIDSIQPMEASASPSVSTVSLTTSTKPRRLTRVTADAWKLAGRLELMGIND